MLTGKWGSGKTYLMREISKKINQGQDTVMIIISLFGLENTEELNRKVKEIIFQIKFNRDASVSSTKGWFSQIKNVISIIGKHSEIAKGINSILSINLYDFVRIENKIECFYGSKLVEKDLVLVFDDFERSKIDTTNLIGVINDYTENKMIKTILIADEEKIIHDGEKYNGYKDLKEKLIFRTIKLRPNYSDIINKIISNYCETFEGYSGFLMTNCQVIEQVFCESKLENIRSLKTMIIDFERVYKKWIEIDIGIENMVDVFYTFGATLLEYRAGKYNESKYGYILCDSKLKDKYSRYGKNKSQLLSLQNWITVGEWDVKDFENEINNRYGTVNLSEDKKFLLYSFWDLNNEIISDGLPIALDRSYEGDLTCDELISLLQKIHTMNKFKINMPLKPDYEKIVKGLDKRETLIKQGKLTEKKRNTFIGNETLLNMEEDEIKLYDKIKKFGERLITWKNRLEFIDYMGNINISRYNLKGGHIVSFDDDLLNIFIRRYKVSENYKKREFDLTLCNLYFIDPRLSDSEDILVSKKNFAILKSKLEAFVDAEKDEISKAITYELIKRLDDMILKLKQQ